MAEYKKAFRITQPKEEKDWLEISRKILFYWLGTASILGYIASVCGLTFSRPLLLLVDLLFVSLMTYLSENSARIYNTRIKIGCVILLLLMLLIPSVQNGISGLSHDTYLAFAKRGIKLIYGGSAVDTDGCKTFVMILTACWLYLLINVCRERPKISMVFFLAVLLLFEMRFGDGKSSGWMFLCFLWILLYYLSSMRAFLFAGLPLLILGAVFLLLFGLSSGSGWNRLWEKVRYANDSSVLPDGDMEEAGEMSRSNKTVLSLNASSPGYYYLKGFVGSVYEDNCWKTDSQSLSDFETGIVAGNNEFLSWLHEKGYSGWNELSDITNASGNKTFTITNLGASRKYLYLPYELKTKASKLESEKLGVFSSGETLLASGLFGKKTYSIKTANSMSDMEIRVSSSSSDTEKKAYAAYEEYVNRTCLTLPRDVKESISECLGGSSTIGVDDTLAIVKKVRGWLSNHVTYSENPGAVSKNMEFTQWFLDDPRGYDVQYATIAVMMFRYYGIPARYVEGYLVENKGTVTQDEAHAWPEIFLSGCGWVPVEVMESYQERMPSYMEENGGTIYTSNSDIQEQESQSEQSTEKQNETQNKNSTQTTETTQNSSVQQGGHGKIPIIVLIIIGILLFILLIIFMSLRFREFLIRRRAVNSISPERSVIMWYRYCIWMIYELETDPKEQAAMAVDNRMLRWEERWIKVHPQVKTKTLHQVGLLRQKAIYRKNGISWQEAEPAVLFFKDEYRYLFGKLSPERKLRVRLGIRPSFLRKQ